MEEISSFFQGGFANFFTKAGDWIVEFAINIIIAILVYIAGRLLITWFVNRFLTKFLKRSRIDVDVHRFIKTTVKVVYCLIPWNHRNTRIPDIFSCSTFRFCRSGCWYVASGKLIKLCRRIITSYI